MRQFFFLSSIPPINHPPSSVLANRQHCDKSCPDVPRNDPSSSYCIHSTYLHLRASKEWDENIVEM